MLGFRPFVEGGNGSRYFVRYSALPVDSIENKQSACTGIGLFTTFASASSCSTTLLPCMCNTLGHRAKCYPKILQ